MMAEPKKILGQKLIDALIKAGIANSVTARVIIDIRVDEIPVVYIEQFGDTRLLEVVPVLAEHRINFNEEHKCNSPMSTLDNLVDTMEDSGDN